MSRLCLSLTGKTLAKNLETIEKYRDYIDLVELRVDLLDADERFHIRRFPEIAGLPVILTIRRDIDGGSFSGGEGARIILFSKGLAFANVNTRNNFAYVDLEADLDVPSLEEAARTFGTRIIRSYYSLQIEDNIQERLKSLCRVGDEIAKVSYIPQSLADTIKLYRAAKETAGMNKIIIGTGRFGASTGILAEIMGSFLCYAKVKGEFDSDAAASGQLGPRELSLLYRFHDINRDTKIFGIAGGSIHADTSPSFFNPLFTQEKKNAVYIPFPAESLASFLTLADEINIRGASIAAPFRDDIVDSIVNSSALAEYIGTCNIIVRRSDGWVGYNTDAMSFSDLFVKFFNKKNLSGRRVTIIGAGAAARGVARHISRLKGVALVLNRTVSRARQLALKYGFTWGGLDSQSVSRIDRYSYIIIQTTATGMEPDINADPLELYNFSGKEMVIDLIYKPEKTRLLTRAEAAGCRILNGYEMFLQSQKYKYNLFMGESLDNEIIAGKL